MSLDELFRLRRYCPEISSVPISRLNKTVLLDCMASAWLAYRFQSQGMESYPGVCSTEECQDARGGRL